MKRIFCMALCLLLLLTVCSGCDRLPFGKEEESSAPLPSEVMSPEEPSGPYRIGLLQFADNPAQDELREAFLSRLEEWGYDEQRLTIDFETAKGDEAQAGRICEKFRQEGAGVVVALSAPAARAAEKVAQTGEFTVISVGEADTTITLKSGVPQTLNVALQIDPKLQKIGLLTNGENAAAKEEVRTFCEAHELELVEAAFDQTGGSVTKAVEELSGKVNTFYTLPGEISQSAGVEAARAAKEKGLAWYAGDGFLVGLGALAAKTADMTEAGFAAADRAVRAMVGETAAEPVTMEAVSLCFNQTTIDALAAVIPEELFEDAATVKQE